MSVFSVLTKGDQIIQLPTPNTSSQITRPFHVNVPFYTDKCSEAWVIKASPQGLFLGEKKKDS